MRKHGKKFTAARAQVAIDRSYSIEDAIPLVQKVKYAKFDETVELTLRLGVDPKHADQMVRGTVVLPHGLGKTKRVLAIAGGEKQAHGEVQALLGSVHHVDAFGSDIHVMMLTEPLGEGFAERWDSCVRGVVGFVPFKACYSGVEDVPWECKARLADAEHDRPWGGPGGLGDFSDLVHGDVADVCGKLRHGSYPSHPYTGKRAFWTGNR